MTLKEQAIQLYKIAFPSDSDGFIDGFFAKYFENSCRYLLKNGQIVSMLFLLPCQLKTKDKSYPTAYLYAAATLPEYRGQGLMAELIEQAKAETAEKSALLVTKPATESLFGYYGKFGFKTAFYSEIYTVYDLPENQKTLTADEYISKREELLKDTPHITLVGDMPFALSGLSLVGSADFCAAIDTEGDAAEVKEYLRRGTDVNSATIPFAMLIKPESIALDEKMHFGIAMD